jgi:hypothetical protein
LKELEQERSHRKVLEERVEDLESSLREIMEENAKIKEDIKEVISDNNILTQHFTQMQD